MTTTSDEATAAAAARRPTSTTPPAAGPTSTASAPTPAPPKRSRRGTEEHDVAGILAEVKLAGGSRRAAFLRDPSRALAFARGIRRLPLSRTAPSDTLAGRMLRESLPATRPFSRLFGHRAVLVIPETPEAYSLGADKQTLRRKARKATKQGVTWRLLDDGAERCAVLQRAEAWAGSTETAGPLEDGNADLVAHGHWLAAFSAAGEPILLAVTPVDGDWAVLRYFRSIGEGPEQSDTRYLLMQVLVEDLSRRGVRYLVDPIPPLDLPAGLQHFQRMIGFRLRRVRVDEEG